MYAHGNDLRRINTQLDHQQDPIIKLKVDIGFYEIVMKTDGPRLVLVAQYPGHTLQIESGDGKSA